MTLEYKFTDAEGNAQVITPDTIADHLSSAGAQVLGISPDGNEIRFQANGQTYVNNVADLINEKYGQVQGFSPVENAIDTSGVNSQWRLAIEALPNDDELRRTYLKSALKQEAGMEHAQIVGTGTDFYVFNPTSKKYVALTNKPGFDWSDVTGFVPTGAKMAGSILGGVGGGLLGTKVPVVGNIVGAGVGSGVGGTVAREGTRWLMEKVDPNFAATRAGMTPDQRTRETIGDALETGLDSAFGGVGAAFPKLLGTGLASKAVQGVGKVADTAGTVVGQGAKAINNPIGRAFGAALTPGLNVIEGTGFAMELPKLLATKPLKWGAQAARWADDKLTKGAFDIAEEAGHTNVRFPVGKKAVDDAYHAMRFGDKARGVAETIESAWAPRAGNKGFEAYNKAFGIAEESTEPTVRNIFGNLGESIGRSAGQSMDEAGKTAHLAGNWAAKGGRTGEKVGATLDYIGDAGAGLQHAAEGIFGAGLKGLEWGGRSTAALGRGLQTAGKITQPLENRALAHYGTNKLDDWGEESLDYASRQWNNRYKPRPKPKYNIYSGE